MRIPQDYSELITRLRKLTQEGRAQWQVFQGGVVVWIGKMGVHLWGGEDDLGDRFVGVGLVKTSKKDEIFDSFTLQHNGHGFDGVNELLVTALRQARGVDVAIKDLIERIDDASGDVGDDGTDYDDIPF